MKSKGKKNRQVRRKKRKGLQGRRKRRRTRWDRLRYRTKGGGSMAPATGLWKIQVEKKKTRRGGEEKRDKVISFFLNI